jgi:hypothetical protein
MIVQKPKSPHDILVVMDQRTKFDREMSEEHGGNFVGSGLSMMRSMIGQHWDRCIRLCLYDYGVKPTPKERAAARAEYREFVDIVAPKIIVVLPTPSKAMAQNNTVQGTQVWKDLTPPDALDDMRGTFWQRGASHVLPVFWPVGTIGEVNIAFMCRWMRAAAFLATNKATILKCTDKHIQVGPKMVQALLSLRGTAIAVDIETIPGRDIVTAIGVSNGVTAVSVPWHEFEAACGSGLSPALRSYPQYETIRGILAELLANPSTVKILHNGVFDGPQLAAIGLPLEGPIEDTLAMHAINYPEARHGLQLAAASELIIPPWKSLFHPKGLKRDQPEFWYWEPDAMRDYNADDAFYTWHLYNQSTWKLGMVPP